MTLKSIPWGKAQIMFRPTLDEEEVKKAAGLVSPSFENFNDVVALSYSNSCIVSTVAKPEPKRFLASLHGVDSTEAMRQALEKMANFLKGRV